MDKDYVKKEVEVSKAADSVKAAEIAEIAERVKKVTDKIALDKVERKEKGIVETAEETKAREAHEELLLKEAKGKLSVKEVDEFTEKKIHTDARNSRVATVKANIEAARLARLELEKKGITETPGAKLDREAKEAKDLKEASVLYVVEPIGEITTQFGSADVNTLRDKINEIIKYYCRGH